MSDLPDTKPLDEIIVGRVGHDKGGHWEVV